MYSLSVFLKNDVCVCAMCCVIVSHSFNCYCFQTNKQINIVPTMTMKSSKVLFNFNASVGGAFDISCLHIMLPFLFWANQPAIQIKRWFFRKSSITKWDCLVHVRCWIFGIIINLRRMAFWNVLETRLPNSNEWCSSIFWLTLFIVWIYAPACIYSFAIISSWHIIHSTFHRCFCVQMCVCC